MCMVGLKAFNSYSKQIQLPSGFTMVVLGPNLVTHLDFIMGDVEKCCIGNFYHFVLHFRFMSLRLRYNDLFIFLLCALMIYLFQLLN